MRHLTGWVVLAIFGLPASWAAAPPGISVDVLERFAVDRDGGFLIVPVTIKGKSYPFMVDTGCTQTVYDDALEHLVGGMAGSAWVATPEKNILVYYYRAPDAYLGKLPLCRGTVSVLDLSVFRRYSHKDIRGILGMDFLRHYIVHIDFDAGTLAIQKRLGPDPGAPLPLQFDRKSLPGVDADVAGKEWPDRFTLDTGYSRGVATVEADLFDSLVSARMLKVTGKARFVSPGHDGTRQFGRLYRMKIGSFVLRQLDVTSTSGESRLGLGFLKRYQVTLDFPGRRIYLRKGKRFDQLAARDVTGLDLHRRGSQTIVREVRDKSPAASAGIKAGDELLMIGEVQAIRTPLLTLQQELCSFLDTVPITLKRNGKTVMVSMLLWGDQRDTGPAKYLLPMPRLLVEQEK
jgi:hypothetical protein